MKEEENCSSDNETKDKTYVKEYNHNIGDMPTKEELLKEKLEELRKRDPFIYR